MKHFKRAISFLISFVMLFAICTISANAAYEVQYGYAADALWEEGLFLGNAGSFDLDQPLTRAAGAVMIVRLLGKEAEAKKGSYKAPFPDVPAWAAPYIGYCYENGIISGIGTTFGSTGKMTAAQFLTLTLRALGYSDKKGDFAWDKAPAKALEIGLIGESCYKQYTTTDVFMRDNAVVISNNALSLPLKGSDTTLKSTIILPGRPDGNKPAYTAALAAALTKTEAKKPDQDSKNATKTAVKKCPRCNGSGRVICTSCSGRGYTFVTIQTMDIITKKSVLKQTMVDCRFCDGSGVKCSNCLGTGWVDN